MPDLENTRLGVWQPHTTISNSISLVQWTIANVRVWPILRTHTSKILKMLLRQRWSTVYLIGSEFSDKSTIANNSFGTTD